MAIVAAASQGWWTTTVRGSSMQQATALLPCGGQRAGLNSIFIKKMKTEFGLRTFQD